MFFKNYENRFRYHAVKYLREEFVEQTNDMKDDEINQKIEKDAGLAASFGIEIEADVMGFVDIMWRLFGKDRDESLPFWALDVLNQKDLSPEKKIYFLRDGYCTTEVIRD